MERPWVMLPVTTEMVFVISVKPPWGSASNGCKMMGEMQIPMRKEMPWQEHTNWKVLGFKVAVKDFSCKISVNVHLNNDVLVTFVHYISVSHLIYLLPCGICLQSWINIFWKLFIALITVSLGNKSGEHLGFLLLGQNLHINKDLGRK